MLQSVHKNLTFNTLGKLQNGRVLHKDALVVAPWYPPQGPRLYKFQRSVYWYTQHWAFVGLDNNNNMNNMNI